MGALALALAGCGGDRSGTSPSPPLLAPTPSLGYADEPADDLSDCFNLTQAPTAFDAIATPLDAKFFINDRRPPVDPDDD
jgi:hypothetical protein